MANPWLERRVLAYAHQGGAREGPSSTLFAIEHALASGADAIELDVHQSADGVLVVCHDPTLERTTDGAGRIADHDFDELLDLDNAYYFVPGEDARPGRPERDYPLRGRAPAERALGVASLAEVLSSFPDTLLNLDIKQTAPLVPPYEEALARLLLAHGRGDDVIVASFDDRATGAFSGFAPGIPTSPGAASLARFYAALLAGERPDPSIGVHAALQVPPTFRGVRLVDERFVAAAHDLGLAVHVWTIDDPDAMVELVRLGVDGIMSDRPSVLAGVLAGVGASYRREAAAGREAASGRIVSPDHSSASYRGSPSSSC